MDAPTHERYQMCQSGSVIDHSNKKGRSPCRLRQSVSTWAKNVFQIHDVDSRGKPVLRKRLRRDQVAAFFGNLSPCLVGMEACSGAHHWARRLEALGHTVKLMAPQFVTHACAAHHAGSMSPYAFAMRSTISLVVAPICSDFGS